MVNPPKVMNEQVAPDARDRIGAFLIPSGMVRAGKRPHSPHAPSVILIPMTDQQPPQQYPAVPPQYQPPPYAPPQQVVPQYVQIVKPPANGIATAALVLGILTAACFATIIGWVFVPILGILAIVFGFVGLSNAGKLNGLGKGKAIAGLILGFSPLVVTVILWIVS